MVFVDPSPLPDLDDVDSSSLPDRDSVPGSPSSLRINLDRAR